MNNRKKNALYSLILLLVILGVWFYRNNTSEQTDTYIVVGGEAQGTTYQIVYRDSLNRNFKSAIDSILRKFDQSLSTYQQGSEINKFNSGDTLYFELPYFHQVLTASKEIYRASHHAFDPTVGPLVDAWGFGPNKVDFPDSSRIDSIQAHIGFDKIHFTSEYVTKKNPAVGLDFNAIAQGQSIDILFRFLESKGIQDLMVELGGELRVKGRNAQNNLWSIGIDNPKPEAENRRIAIIKLTDEAISTSGNYRNFFVHEGTKYGHTIDPRTGYPVQRDIISATVVAPTCMEADAWSTTFMVTGLEEAKKILTGQPQLKVFFLYENEAGETQTYYSDSLKASLIL